MTLVLSCWLFQSIWPKKSSSNGIISPSRGRAIIVGKKQVHPAKLTWMEPNRGGLVQIMFRLTRMGDGCRFQPFIFQDVRKVLHLQDTHLQSFQAPLARALYCRWHSSKLDEKIQMPPKSDMGKF